MKYIKLNKILIIFLFVSEFCALKIAAATSDDHSEKCDYRFTVDLTNHTQYDDGSYEYQGFLVPPEDQSLYDYRLLMGDEKVDAPQHLRGCLCNKTMSCIKLCCEIDSFFNTTTFKCEKLSRHFEISWDLTIRLKHYFDKKVNIFKQFIYQVGVPCNEPEALITDQYKWDLFEDGRLHMMNDDVYLDTVDYCFTPYRFKESVEYLLLPLSCPFKNDITPTLILNTYGMALSVLFFVPTIIVYIFIKELRGNLRGKLLICYLLSLVVAYGIISFINIAHMIFEFTTCCILGFTCYFFFMAAYLWLSILCYDMWKNFREINFELNSRENIQRFLYYSLHAWGWAAVFTGLTIWAEFSPSIANKYKPGIGIKMCWLDTLKWSAAIYFYGPNLVILLFNIVTFTYLTIHIYKVRRDSAKIAHKENCFQENVLVILRLFLIMGVSWIFDIISYCLPYTKTWQLVFILSDLVNATQGILIFSMFVLKRNVRDLLKKRLTAVKQVRSRWSKTSSPTMCTKL